MATVPKPTAGVALIPAAVSDRVRPEHRQHRAEIVGEVEVGGATRDGRLQDRLGGGLERPRHVDDHIRPLERLRQRVALHRGGDPRPTEPATERGEEDLVAGDEEHVEAAGDGDLGHERAGPAGRTDHCQHAWILAETTRGGEDPAAAAPGRSPGGPCRVRTDDIHGVNVALYRLS